MSNFILELDTTGPVIAVYGPQYATNVNPETMTVEANEQLAQYQDFYFIDAAGERRNVIFEHQGNKFFGTVDFSVFAIGFATFYARLMDEVNNLSNTAMHVVNIIDAAEVDIITNDFTRLIDSGNESRLIASNEVTRNIAATDHNRIINTGESTRIIEVGEQSEHTPSG